jgi:hypothetical protein
MELILILGYASTKRLRTAGLDKNTMWYPVYLLTIKQKREKKDRIKRENN